MCHFINDATTHCPSHASQVCFLGRVLSCETAGSESMHLCKGFDRDGRILSRKFLIIPVLTAHANIGNRGVGREGGPQMDLCLSKDPKPLSSAARRALRVATCPCSVASPPPSVQPHCSPFTLLLHPHCYNVHIAESFQSFGPPLKSQQTSLQMSDPMPLACHQHY